jgi:glycosyltransferase involved in cell wall biosynthesis
VNVSPVSRDYHKLRVLFVGAFEPSPGSSVRGGQLAACRAILKSPLSEHVEWHLIESMMESLPPPPLSRRAWLAAMRVMRFSWWLLTRQIDAVLIFTSSDWSIAEKGLMAVIAKVMNVRVVLCPRSGFLIQEYRRAAIMRFWLRIVIRCSDNVICQGRRWREFFSSVSGLPQDRFPIIYNIVGDNAFDPLELPGREEAQKALLMGWVERNKGIFDLLETVNRFRLEMLGMKFVICGQGKDWDEFKVELKKHKLEEFFEMRGWVDEHGKKKELSAADFCLMLSHCEGMPNALLESMAAGRPVVATSVGAVSDIVEEGRNGFLCEPRDVDEIGFRILDLRQSLQLRRAMGNRARESVKGAMGSEVVWRNWLAALRPKGPTFRSGEKTQ